jgi:hypothetical protein
VACQVRKENGGLAGIQSLSETAAKHLKNEFLDRKVAGTGKAVAT